METPRSKRLVEQHAMACACAAKALSEAREARARGGDTRAARALERRLRLEIAEHQQRMQALMGDGKTQGGA